MSGTLRSYTLGPVKPWVKTAAEEIGTEFNVAIVYGYGPGSVSGSDHPKGLALDFMTSSKAKGDAIAAYAISNADRLGITYVIWYRRIWENGAWKAYHGSSNPHTDHVHISFSASGGDSRATGTTTETVGLLSPSSWPIVSQLNGIAARVEDPARWKRFGYYVLGFFLVAVGAVILFRNGAEREIGKVL